MKNTINVINYHITGRCNYNCKHCFAKYRNTQECSFEDAKKIVDNIGNYFKANNIQGRINLAGGEPLLVDYIDDLIDYIHKLGIKVSIVTNGSLLTIERIKKYANANTVETIALSIDSLSPSSNLTIGRATSNNATLNEENIKILAAVIKNCKIKLKINTVVTKYNIDENFNEIINAVKPDRLKIFQMLVIDNVNESAKALQISDAKFNEFCSRIDYPEIIKEYANDMQNSYVMINPEGKMINSNYEVVGSCLDGDFESLMKNNNIDCKKFNKRY